MAVTVLFFAKARELVGVSRESWEIQQGWTTKDLQKAVISKHDSLTKLVPTCAWALNEVYLDEPKELQNGDTLALIPAISGG